MSKQSKLNLLLEIDNYKRKGFYSYRNITIDSPIEEIYFELKMLKNQERIAKEKSFMKLMEESFNSINESVRDKFNIDIEDTLLDELHNFANKNNYVYTKEEIKNLMKEYLKSKVNEK